MASLALAVLTLLLIAINIMPMLHVHTRINLLPNILCSGTHDIQNILVSSPLPGQVRVTGEFIEGSTATGVLVIVYSQSNDSDTHYKSCKRDGQNTEITVDGLTGGHYGVSVFVLENGLPSQLVFVSPVPSWMFLPLTV